MAKILDIQLGEDGDIVLTGSGDFFLADSVIQKIETKLRWIEGEWQWDEELGFPYFDYLGVKSPDLGVMEEMISDTIFEIDEVTEVPQVSISIDKDTRLARVSFVVRTDMETYRKEITING